MADGSGRLVYVGIGKETTRGTSLAPTYWPKWLDFDFIDRIEKVKNDSAIGVLDMYNDSEITQKWGEGALGGKLGDKSFGLILTGAFGVAPSSALKGGESVVYNHTYTPANTAVAQSLTLVRKDSNTNKRYALAMLGKLDVEVVVGEYAKYSAEFTAKKGVTGTDTPSLTSENEFVPRHATVKMATTTAGLGAATAIPLKSIKFSVDNHVEPYFVLGADDPQEINNLEREVTGELVLRYTDSTYETIWAANTDQAISVTIANTDVTIGTSSNPTIAFTFPRITLEEFEKTPDKSGIVEQTFKFTALYDYTATNSISAVLTNTIASY